MSGIGCRTERARAPEGPRRAGEAQEKCHNPGLVFWGSQVQVETSVGLRHPLFCAALPPGFERGAEGEC